MGQIAFRCVRFRIGAAQIVTVARRRQQSAVAVLARGDLLAAIYASLTLLHSDSFNRFALSSIRLNREVVFFNMSNRNAKIADP